MDNKDTRYYRRQTQRTIIPTGIKARSLAEQTLVNTTVDTQGPFNVGNGGSLSVRSIIRNTANASFIIGAAPYCITFFEGALDTTKIIGDSITGGYVINGPMAMSQFSPNATSLAAGGNTGYNVVFVTELVNNTGGSKNIYFITNTRVYNPRGGGGS